MKTLKELLTMSLAQKASDIHIAEGTPPQFRIDGHLVKVDAHVLTREESKELCYQIVTPEQIKEFETRHELDLSFSHENKSRFRANIFMQQESVAAALRPIPMVIPKLEELGLPQSITDLTEKANGLILVTGPTGSGKSTTLAAMIDRINEKHHEHIITVEDPIEFVHTHKNSVISQREVGRDTESFITALKYILRQDPDVVLIGEMRDLATISAAITTAETGHLVFATLHTNTAASTIDRIIDVFPSHQQSQIRTQLSFILQGVISQQLIPKKKGGRAAALEILISTPAIRNLIRENKVHQIYSQMQVGQEKSGMITLNQSLARLVREGHIEKNEALSHTSDRDELERMIGVN